MKKTLITTSLIAALFAVPAFADPTAQELLDQKTVTSKYYVDTTKQDIIPTDDVLLGLDGKKEEIYVPALVTTDAKEDGGLAGYAFGIVGSGDLGDLEWGMSELLSESVTDPDALVPTVRVVADAISDGLALKQNKIDAGISGNVVTYTGTAGQVGSANVASDALYSNNTLYNGSDVANIAAVETKQDKMTCAGYLAGHENDEDYCWLYSVAETRQTCTPNSQSCDPSNNTCCSGFCNPDKLGNYHCRATPF